MSPKIFKAESPVKPSFSRCDLTLAYAPLLALMDKECFEEALCWSEDLFISVLETGGWGELLLMEESPVGFYLCRSAAGETEILTLGVLPSYQRQGFGKFLIQGIFKGALKRKTREVFLEVEESNLPACHLYLTSGFQTLGRRPDYYAKGRDALVMGCDLTLMERI